MSCPLCHKNKKNPVSGDDQRTYFLCENCLLIYANPEQRPSRVMEKTRYEQHENSINNKGYVTFLNQIITPTLPYLTKGMRGLDYGCGPHPTLSLILKKQDHHCEDYDPIFFKRELKSFYDYIFATECFEHFFNPNDEIRNIHELLKMGGLLALMTEQWQSIKAFKTWYYTRDPTHVSFYHETTFQYIEREFGFETVLSDGKRIRLFRKIDAEDPAKEKSVP